MASIPCESCKVRPASGLYELRTGKKAKHIEALCGACGLNVCTRRRVHIMRDDDGKEFVFTKLSVKEAVLLPKLAWEIYKAAS